MEGTAMGRYGACVGFPLPGFVVYDDDELDKVYGWIDCLTGSMQAPIYIIDFTSYEVLGTVSLNKKC
jgi:hypothetical protein